MTFRILRLFSLGEWEYWNPLLYNSNREYRFFYLWYLTNYKWNKEI